MMSRTHVALLVATLALTTACGSDDPAGSSSAWPTTSTPVATDGLIWASGSTVHLPDGSTIDTGDPAGAYVVAGAGVWFASAEPGEREGNDLPELRVATADGVRDLGAHPAIGSLTTSADGRWLAFIDRLENGAGAAEAVVVDLTTGEELVRSSEGLLPSETEGADWTDLYEDAPVGMLGVVDGTAYIQGLDALVSHDLSTGESTSEDLDWEAIRASDWWQSLHLTAPLPNADRTWQIPTQEFGATPVLESADGQRVTTTLLDATGPLGSPDVTGPPLEDWRLRGWIDETTALGITPSRDGSGVDWLTPVLVTCAVPSGECAVVEGTEEGVNLPSDRPFGLPRESSIDPDS
ncbi:hypothetical protein CFI00_21390 [Nocardioides sp. S5]|uniref:hypothetical protein n=1 Tax=Nocardioides sp. S5 TaxID=2017486 RepID=UPI001A8C84A4|nr:hypothetical protein [Nocardioides sp. S5]QSR33009.1 hypothetical protein CFI00_21390 [Nocardioides sp. S5]